MVDRKIITKSEAPLKALNNLSSQLRSQDSLFLHQEVGTLRHWSFEEIGHRYMDDESAIKCKSAFLKTIIYKKTKRSCNESYIIFDKNLH